MSDGFDLMMGGRMVHFSTVPAIDIQLKRDKLPPYPAGDEARLAVWRAKKITTTPKETREYLADLFGATCHLCEQPIDMNVPSKHPGAPQIDHLVPKSSDGSYTWGNVALAHRTCNSSKNDLRGGVRDPAIYRQKLADALFIHDGSAAIALERALHRQRSYDETASLLPFGDKSAGRKKLGMTEGEWVVYRADLEADLADERPELDALWADYATARARLGWPESTTRTVDPRMHDERPDIDAVLTRMQEKLAARHAEGDGMTMRLRGTINLLQRTQILLDEDLGIKRW
jgi:5-methylcytosine-specific restriction endonuclease McrA